MDKSSSISDNKKSSEFGLLFPKAFDIDTSTASNLDKYLGDLAPTLFFDRELFGGFKVINSTYTTYDVVIELANGTTQTYAILPGVFENIMGRRILTGTDTTIVVRVYGGQ